MLRLMIMRGLLAVAISAVLLVGPFTSFPAKADWTSWTCFSTGSWPVPGSIVVGRGCDSFWTGPELWWAVWADTADGTSYQIYTYVAGYDRCGSDPWSLRMSGDSTVSNTNYGTSDSHSGTYQDCTSGHSYREFGSHWRKLTSGSSWEGGTGYTVAH
jgi:hypothetical protein